MIDLNLCWVPHWTSPARNTKYTMTTQRQEPRAGKVCVRVWQMLKCVSWLHFFSPSFRSFGRKEEAKEENFYSPELKVRPRTTTTISPTSGRRILGVQCLASFTFCRPSFELNVRWRKTESITSQAKRSRMIARHFFTYFFSAH